MVAFYVHRIETDKMALEGVPARWREDVEAELYRKRGSMM